jgi:hypothetical protein
VHDDAGRQRHLSVSRQRKTSGKLLEALARASSTKESHRTFFQDLLNGFEKLAEGTNAVDRHRALQSPGQAKLLLEDLCTQA